MRHWLMRSRGADDGYAGGCRRVQGPPESLSVGTCAVLAPCLREARSCLVAAWWQGGCCPRGPVPGDLVRLLLASRAPYSPAVLLAAHHPTGECGPSPSWAPWWVGGRGAEFSAHNMASLGKRTSASAASDPSASAVPNPPASASTLASANPQAPDPSASAEPRVPYQPPASANPSASAGPPASTNPKTSAASRDRVNPSTPRVLIITSESKKLSSLSPFQRKEGCDHFGRVSRCDKLRDGGLEVEFTNDEDAKQALSATEFIYSVKDGDSRRQIRIPIAVSAHRTKNTSRGVIYCVDLEDISDEDITDGLSAFGVVSARRIKTRKNGVLVPTHSVILTFDQLDLPREVPIGYIKVKVRQYIPSPMRCFRCLRFGHTQVYCKNRTTCSKCAASGHTGDECTAELTRCVNCGEGEAPHSALDPKCPALKRERDIVAIKYTEKVSFREARERYNATHPRRSYASVAKGAQPTRPESGPQHGNISQLITLLRSFGLTLTGPGVPPGPAAHTPQPPAVANPTAETQTSPTRSGEAHRSDPGGGWTLVQGRRGSGQPRTAASRPGSATPPVRSPINPSEPAGTAVMEALRRGEEERRAREAKRARLAERARETLRSPGVEAASDPSATRPAPLEPSSAGKPPPMGPPPPPPPLRRPPPLPQQSEAAQSPSVATTAAGKPAEERPTKRSLPLEGSPTDGGTPRARQRCQPGTATGRSSSADGRLRRGHAPIRFGESTFSGASHYF